MAPPHTNLHIPWVPGQLCLSHIEQMYWKCGNHLGHATPAHSLAMGLYLNAQRLTEIMICYMLLSIDIKRTWRSFLFFLFAASSFQLALVYKNLLLPFRPNNSLLLFIFHHLFLLLQVLSSSITRVVPVPLTFPDQIHNPNYGWISQHATS